MLRPLLAVVLVLLLTAWPAAARQAAPNPRPDAVIRTPSQQAWGGNNVYNLTGAGQSRSAQLEPGRDAHFYVRIQNDDDQTAHIRVWGTSESDAFAVRYFVGSQQVSPPVKAGTFMLRNLRPGQYRTVTVEVEARRGAPRGARRQVVVSARSPAVPTVRDNVAIDVAVPLYSAEQRRIAELINQSRRQHGRGGLALHQQLTRKAQSWAGYLAVLGRLAHSNLAAGVPSGWRRLAENVGTGGSLSGIHAAFMGSGGHRDNILGPFNHVGTGSARGHGRLWVVHVFMLR